MPNSRRRMPPSSKQTTRQAWVSSFSMCSKATLWPSETSIRARRSSRVRQKWRWLRLMPLDDNVSSGSFDLNNALNVSRVVDDKGNQIPASRNQADSTVRLSFEPPLPKGQPFNVTFYYDGKLTGQEESPVYGVKFAAIHPDFAYLMYPARWFPVAGYSTDRFAADLRIAVPAGYKVLASGFDSQAQSANGKTTVEFK